MSPIVCLTSRPATDQQLNIMLWEDGDKILSVELSVDQAEHLRDALDAALDPEAGA